MAEPVACSEGGYLVGPDRVVPADPAERQWPDPMKAGAVVGCNRLACRSCGQAVVQRPGFDAAKELKRQRQELLPQVYADGAGAAGWEAWVARGVLERDARVRLYVCRCALHAERMVSPVEGEPDGRPGGPSSWRCAGHPPAGAVATSGAPKESGSGEAAAAFVAAALDGEHGGPEAIDRRYNLAGDAGLRQAIGTAVLAQVTSSDARRRMRALGFFSRNPGAPQAAELAAQYAAHRLLFDGVADPFGRRPSVAAFFHEVLADRLDPRHGFADAAAAREALRAALLAGAPVPARALAALASFDQAWLAEHADAAIAAGSADEVTARAGAVVHALRYLSMDPSGRRTDDAFAELLRRAAAVPGVDRDQLRQLLVEAIGGTTAELVQRTLGS